MSFLLLCRDYYIALAHFWPKACACQTHNMIQCSLNGGVDDDKQIRTSFIEMHTAQYLFFSNSGLKASFSNASLQIPRGKWRPSGAPEVDSSATEARTPPALKEARRQMNQEEAIERQQNEENTIKVDIR